jgi:hypothetical protein
VLADDSGGLAVMTLAIRRRAPANVVQAGGGLKHETIWITQAVQVLDLIEQMDRQHGDVQDVMRLFFQRMHEGEEFLAGGFDVHGVSSSAP